MIVIDSSVLIDVLVGSAHAAERIAGEQLVAPHLIDAEVGHSLRRLTTSRSVDDLSAGSALTEFVELSIVRYSHGVLMHRAWDLRANVSFYDALYVALAEMLDVPLVTLDRRLAGAPGILAAVEVIGTG